MTPSRGAPPAAAASRSLRVLLAGALGALAFLLVLVVTEPPGPGLDPDSMSYLGAAESLVHRGALRIPAADWASVDSTAPLTHFPPGYPAAIAVPVTLGMSSMQGARLVSALAAFVTVAVAVLLVGGAGGWLAGVVAGVMLLVTPAVVDVHLDVLSEPLFLALMVLTVALMAWAPRRALAWGVVAALAASVRYAGVGIVAAAALWGALQAGPWPARLRRLVLALVPSALLLGWWAWRSTRLGGASAIRDFGAYGGLRGALLEGAQTLAAWLAPGLAPPTQWVVAAVVLLAAGLLVTVAVIALARDWRATTRLERMLMPPDSGATLRIFEVAGLAALCYAAVIVASRAAADPNIPFDVRILSPLIVLGDLVIALALGVWWRAHRWTLMRVLAAAALLVWLWGSLRVSLDDASYAMDTGDDFAGESWRTSPLLAWVRAQGAGHPLYSNWTSAVWFYTHRPARELPPSLDPRTVAAFGDTLAHRAGALIVGFATPSPGVASPDSLAVLLGLHPVARLADGIVWAR